MLFVSCCFLFNGKKKKSEFYVIYLFERVFRRRWKQKKDRKDSELIGRVNWKNSEKCVRAHGIT